MTIFKTAFVKQPNDRNHIKCIFSRRRKIGNFIYNALKYNRIKESENVKLTAFVVCSFLLVVNFDCVGRCDFFAGFALIFGMPYIHNWFGCFCGSLIVDTCHCFPTESLLSFIMWMPSNFIWISLTLSRTAFVWKITEDLVFENSRHGWGWIIWFLKNKDDFGRKKFTKTKTKTDFFMIEALP